MRIIHEPKINFDDVIIAPQRTTLSSRAQVKLERTFEFFHSPRTWTGIPIMVSNMFCTGTVKMGRALAKQKVVTCLNKYHSADFLLDQNLGYGELDYIWMSTGMDLAELEQIEIFATSYGVQPNICVDVANGHMESFVEFCSLVRSKFQQSIIMAGNVANPACTQELIIHGGVDIVKVGIGPGSHCTTLTTTGVGYPQLSAIIESSSVAHGLKSQPKRLGLICGDGGLRATGDFSKGFCAGADFLMAGGYFAGSSECEGEWIYEYDLRGSDVASNERKSQRRPVGLKFYGMSSKHAQERHTTFKNYRASEGLVSDVKFKGSASELLRECLGGLRSTGTYIGADSLKDFNKCAVFVMKR